MVHDGSLFLLEFRLQPGALDSRGRRRILTYGCNRTIDRQERRLSLNSNSRLERKLAYASRTGLAGAANNSAPAAVQGVKGCVGATAGAVRASSRAGNVAAFPAVAVRSGFGADIAAGAAIVRIGIEE